jgi:hypothetical protein
VPSMALRRGPVTNVLKDMKCGLVTDTHSSLTILRIHFSQLFMYMGLMMFGRLRYGQQNQYCLSPALLILKGYLKAKKIQITR